MRILHLVDLRHEGDEPILACQAANQASCTEHRVIGLGSNADAARAGRMGLFLTDLITPPGLAAETAFRRLRHLMGDRNGRNSTRPWADLLQCWSVPALGLARLASGRRTPPRVGALVRSPHSSSIFSPLWMVRSKFALHDTTLFSFDRSVRAAWAEPASARRGGCLLEQNIRLLPPPALSNVPTPDLRLAIRQRLGLQAADVAVALLADPADVGDAQRFAFTLGLLYTTGQRVVGIVPRGIGHASRARQFVRMHGHNWGLLITPEPLSSVLPACDLSMWDSTCASGSIDGSSGLTLLRASIASGVPPVAARHELSIAALGSIAPELVARDGSLNAVANRLLWLLENDSARSRMSGLCRHSTRANTHESTFAPELLRLWQEVANIPVARPGLPTPLALMGSLA